MVKGAEELQDDRRLATLLEHDGRVGLLAGEHARAGHAAHIHPHLGERGDGEVLVPRGIDEGTAVPGVDDVGLVGRRRRHQGHVVEGGQRAGVVHDEIAGAAGRSRLRVEDPQARLVPFTGIPALSRHPGRERIDEVHAPPWRGSDARHKGWTRAVIACNPAPPTVEG